MKQLKFFIVILMLSTSELEAQDLNRIFLLGYDIALFDTNVTSTKARLVFDTANFVLQPESRKLSFMASQATISDANGNLRMATNGCWIMDATGDTMLNGSGLNPGSFSNSWCSNNSGQPFSGTTMFVNWPGDTSKYVLFHQTGNYSQPNAMPTELYSSIIDMALSNGLGGVVSKNNIIIQDILSFGLTACKHANGRDWWIVALKAYSSEIYTILLTPNGVQSVSQQTLGFPSHNDYGGTPVFSNDGSKFSYYYYSGTINNFLIQVRLADFDRCTGLFSNFTTVNHADSLYGFSLSFSPDSKYLYWATFNKVYQINTDTSDISASKQLVAVNDGYYSPYPPFQTDFWLMYLAANGKIYISSGNSVLDLHYIEHPDSAGIACGVQQHALHLPCYSGRGHVNHPNYALGPVAGSVCDSLGVGLPELEQVRNVRISPNPVASGGSLSLLYELPQNKAGVFELKDPLGRLTYTYQLPPWSNMQSLQLPALSSGLYLCSIRSGGSQITMKVVVN